MPGDNTALVRRFVDEGFNRGDLASLDAILAPAFVDHSAPENVPPTRDGFKRTVTIFRTAFPDFHMTVEDVFADGDKVVFRDTYRGTHRGEFFGIAPTGKQIAVTETHIVYCADGQITDHWYNGDDLGMMKQLGVYSPPS